LVGPEGVGKTLVAQRLLADLTLGGLEGELEGQPQNVLIVAAEDHLTSVLKPRLTASGADMKRVLIEGSSRGHSHLELPRDVHRLAETVRTHDIGVVYVDSLISVLPGGFRTNDYKATTELMQALNRLAEEENVTVVATWHVNKSRSRDGATRTMGSRGLRAGARSVLMVERAPGREPSEGVGQVVLDKSNGSTRDVPPRQFCIESRTVPFDAVDPQTGEIRREETNAGVAIWVDDAEQQPLDVRIEPPTATARWLVNYLVENGGEAPRKAIVEAGELAGHNLTALHKARIALGLAFQTVGGNVDRLPTRHTVWILPEDSVWAVTDDAA
jgi:hypothetical protein